VLPLGAGTGAPDALVPDAGGGAGNAVGPDMRALDVAAEDVDSSTARMVVASAA
jgi:hypothetical protein